MNDVKPRYNSGIQRSKGLLEMAAALYDTSLSTRHTRSGTDVPQINSRVGARLSLRIDSQREESESGTSSLDISFVAGGFRHNLMQVAEKAVSLVWINPAMPLALAHRGLPPFPGPQPLRAVACFPSWDAVVFAVHESTGITSIEQIRERRPPLRVSTGRTITPPFDEDGTMFAVGRMAAAAGFGLDDIPAWGGSFQTVSRPSHTSRSEAIRAGEVDAVFDEGILSWGRFAVEHGFRFLPVEGAVEERLKADGFDIGTVTEQRIPGLPESVPTVDFSGWPMVVHADMEDAVAYALCEAIELRRNEIPTDNFKPLDLAQICRGDDEAPMVAPLHPGAERFWRERGYLR